MSFHDSPRQSIRKRKNVKLTEMENRTEAENNLSTAELDATQLNNMNAENMEMRIESDTNTENREVYEWNESDVNKKSKESNKENEENENSNEKNGNVKNENDISADIYVTIRRKRTEDRNNSVDSEGVTVSKPTESTEMSGSFKKDVLNTTIRNRIIILADDQGKNMQRTLQTIIGDRYQITCVWKPGATMQKVLDSGKEDIKTLGAKDYVVVLCGLNETLPNEFHFYLGSWVSGINKNTNILI